jgi:hypothetical protein
MGAIKHHNENCSKRMKQAPDGKSWVDEETHEVTGGFLYFLDGCSRSSIIAPAYSSGFATTACRVISSSFSSHSEFYCAGGNPEPEAAARGRVEAEAAFKHVAGG